MFPGGVTDNSDHSFEWAKLFKSAGFDDAQWKSVSNIAGPRPEMFDDYRNSALDPDVAFRICALREAFEESGLLLVKASQGTRFAGFSHTESLAWRKKVHKNASTFLEMCQ